MLYHERGRAAVKCTVVTCWFVEHFVTLFMVYYTRAEKKQCKRHPVKNVSLQAQGCAMLPCNDVLKDSDANNVPKEPKQSITSSKTHPC